MNGSPSTKSLDAALFAAKHTIASPAKDGANPHFKSQYQTLNAIQNAIRHAMLENGLLYISSPQMLTPPTGPVSVLEWKLVHRESGEFISGGCPLVVDKPGPQALGSAITYMRRYNLSALFSLNADDDDGEGAECRQTQTTPNGAAVKKAESQPAPSPNLTIDMIIMDLKKCKDEAAVKELVDKYRKFISTSHSDGKATFKAAYEMKMGEFQHTGE